MRARWWNARCAAATLPGTPHQALSAQFCNANPAQCLGYKGIGSLGQDLHGYGGGTPAEIFQQYRNETVQRFGGTISPTWRPLTWLQNDLESTVQDYILFAQTE